MNKIDSYLIFLGTAGARLMVTKQLLASGGAWLKINNTELLIDPGPGSLVHSIRKKLSPQKLHAIILSHKHIDHSNDINIMIEAMTQGGFKKHGIVFAPSDAFGDQGVILPYLTNYVEQWVILTEGKTYYIGDIILKTPKKHVHPVETYGFIFKFNDITFSWIQDTKYFDELCELYFGEIIVINTVLKNQVDDIDHLSIADTKRLIENIKPKVAIITHFGMGIWQSKPWIVAKKLSDDTGIKVVAARDGMKFDFNNL